MQGRDDACHIEVAGQGEYMRPLSAKEMSSETDISPHPKETKGKLKKNKTRQIYTKGP